MTDQATCENEFDGPGLRRREYWLDRVELLLQKTFGKTFDLDGDSLDFAVDIFKAGKSPIAAALAILPAVRKQREAIEAARATLREYWNSAEDDLSHLKRGEFEGRIVAACNLLEDRGDKFDTFVIERLVETAPAIFDYDENGDYTGAVAHENGFTNH